MHLVRRGWGIRDWRLRVAVDAERHAVGRRHFLWADGDFAWADGDLP
jgi:hypothetical protein